MVWGHGSFLWARASTNQSAARVRRHHAPRANMPNQRIDVTDDVGKRENSRKRKNVEKTKNRINYPKFGHVQGEIISNTENGREKMDLMGKKRV